MFRDDINAKYREGKRNFDARRYEDAERCFREADTEFPNDREITYALARCLVKLRKLDDAHKLANRLQNLLNDPRGHLLHQRIRELRPDAAQDSEG